MPGTRCTVAVCNNSYRLSKRAGVHITYHKFPNHQPHRDIWIKACRRAGKWNPTSCHICSLHFTKNDYKEVPNIVGKKFSTKRRLKPTAVPTLFLTEPPPMEFRIHETKKKTKRFDNTYDEAMQESIEYTNEVDDTQESIDDVTVYEEYVPENSNDFEVIFESNEENADSIEQYFDVKDVGTEEEYSLVDNNYIIVRDCSTQTDANSFLENYQLLLDEKESLEKEIARWNDRYRKIMMNMKHLQSQVQTLTMHSADAQSAI